jgi:hypothetical protein
MAATAIALEPSGTQRVGLDFFIYLFIYLQKASSFKTYMLHLYSPTS